MQTDGGLAFVTILDMVALEQKFGGAIGSHYLQSLLFLLQSPTCHPGNLACRADREYLRNVDLRCHYFPIPTALALMGMLRV